MPNRLGLGLGRSCRIPLWCTYPWHRWRDCQSADPPSRVGCVRGGMATGRRAAKLSDGLYLAIAQHVTRTGCSGAITASSARAASRPFCHDGSGRPVDRTGARAVECVRR
jgi:hypothetical protein